jgi:hypothetical protein
VVGKMNFADYCQHKNFSDQSKPLAILLAESLLLLQRNARTDPESRNLETGAESLAHKNISEQPKPSRNNVFSFVE